MLDPVSITAGVTVLTSALGAAIGKISVDAAVSAIGSGLAGNAAMELAKAACRKAVGSVELLRDHLSRLDPRENHILFHAMVFAYWQSIAQVAYQHCKLFNLTRSEGGGPLLELIDTCRARMKSAKTSAPGTLSEDGWKSAIQSAYSELTALVAQDVKDSTNSPGHEGPALLAWKALQAEFPAAAESFRFESVFFEKWFYQFTVNFQFTATKDPQLRDLLLLRLFSEISSFNGGEVLKAEAILNAFEQLGSQIQHGLAGVHEAINAMRTEVGHQIINLSRRSDENTEKILSSIRDSHSAAAHCPRITAETILLDNGVLAMQGISEDLASQIVNAFERRQSAFYLAPLKGGKGWPPVPPRPARCLGREREIEELVSHLIRHPEPISAIVHGGPGLGKSTLVREISHRSEIITKYGSNILFFELDQITDSTAMLASVVNLLDGSPTAAPTSIGEAISILTSSAPALLIFDNLETVWNSDPVACEAQLQSVNDFSPNTAVLVTFRGTDLPPAPRWTIRHNISPLTNEVSRRLFLDIAPDIHSDDLFLDHFLSELGGVPLAIELVALEAAPFERLGPTWERWQQVGTSLAKRRHVEAGRTTSLEYSIELSLKSPSRNPAILDALRAVALLHGGLDEIVAEKILGEEFYDAVRDLLGSGLGLRSQNRIDVLPPVRRYVLTAYGITEALIRKLIIAYSSLALSLFSPVTSAAALDAALSAEDQNWTCPLA